MINRHAPIKPPTILCDLDRKWILYWSVNEKPGDSINRWSFDVMINQTFSSEGPSFKYVVNRDGEQIILVPEDDYKGTLTFMEESGHDVDIPKYQETHWSLGDTKIIKNLWCGYIDDQLVTVYDLIEDAHRRWDALQYLVTPHVSM